MTEDAEGFLLSICLSASERAYFDAATIVQAEDFDSPGHRAIWSAIGRVAERARPDSQLVYRELGEDVGLVDDLGGRSYLSLLASANVYPGNLGEYVQAVARDAEHRRLRHRLQDALEEPNLSVSALAESLYRLERRPRDGVTAKEALGELFVQAEQATVPGIRYPWEPVQRLTGGLRPGWLCYLAGETSHGKTAAALALADTVVQDGGRVCFISLEMSPVEIAMRLCQRHGLAQSRIYHGKATPEDFAKLSALMGHDWAERFFIESVVRVEQIPGLILRRRPDLVVLDYLGLLHTAGRDRREGVDLNSRALKLMAMRHQVPIVCLVQLSRAAREERNKAPGIWRLKESGNLENDADQVVMVWRRRDENNQLGSEGSLNVVKARMGETGAARMTFKGETQELEVMWQ